MKHKDSILKLRSEGKSYTEIQSILGCSKGTICYHCGENQKNKTYERKNKLDNRKIIQKIYNFYYNTNKEKKIYDKYKSVFNKRITDKILSFHRERKNMKQYRKASFTVNDVINMHKNNSTCALTGDEIDLNDTRSWHLDHIIPVSKGGDDSLSNCQITTKTANMAKGNMEIDEFISFCTKVLTHHGYNVTKGT